MSSSTWLEAYLVNCAIHLHILHPLGLRQPNFIDVPVLEPIGFLFRAFVSDGASPNRKFYKMMAQRD